MATPNLWNLTTSPQRSRFKILRVTQVFFLPPHLHVNRLIFAVQTSEFQTYLQHEPANFKLICSTNKQISNLLAARTSEFQTHLQHKPANFKLICSTNQRISNLFAAQTSKFQTYLQHKPANFKLICSTNQRIANLFAARTNEFPPVNRVLTKKY